MSGVAMGVCSRHWDTYNKQKIKTFLQQANVQVAMAMFHLWEGVFFMGAGDCNVRECCTGEGGGYWQASPAGGGEEEACG